MLENKKWQPLPGTLQAEIFPVIRKPDIICSNAYIIRTPQQIVIIDPGSLPEQMALLKEALKEDSGKQIRPIYIFFTHCHVDHCYQALIVNELSGIAPVYLAAQENGAAALRNRDLRRTVADSLRKELPGTDVDIVLLSNEDKLHCGEKVIVLAGGHPLRVFTDLYPVKEGQALFRQTMSIGESDVMEIFHTPGHSADSICLCIGASLFVGDLAFAVNNGIAGLIGWNQQDLVHTLEGLINLLHIRRIRLICPGHGRIIPEDKAIETLQKQLRIARNLTNLRELNLAVFREISQYALDLLVDVNDMVAIIAGRLYCLAFYLEELDEPVEAQKYREFISLDAIDDLLSEYDHCAAELEKGKMFECNMVLKTARLLEKIRALLNEGKLELIIDKYFMRRAMRLFSDFELISGGRPLEITDESHNMNQLLEDLLAEAKTNQYEEDYIFEVLDDNERYLEALATRIAFQPVLQEVQWSFIPGDVPAVRLNAERFKEAYLGLLEEIASLDVPDLRVATLSHEKGVIVRTDSINGIPGEVINDRKFSTHQRRIELAGGQLHKEATGDKIRFDIIFLSAGHSLNLPHVARIQPE